MKTIFIVMKGGLGNQLFQAAMGLALTHTTGVTARFVTNSFGDDTYGRSYLLDSFPALRDLAVSPTDAIRSKILNEEALAGLAPPDRIRQIQAILVSEDTLVLDGYWQDEGYWGDSSDFIRATLRPEVSDMMADRGAQIRAVGAVGMHVRRADYGHHGLARTDYFIEALAAVRRETDASLTFYATDEPNFCKFQFRHIKDLLMLPGNQNAPLEDFFLLSCCRHFVISNSSFSWWAAFLGEQPDSVIYAPQPWCIFDASANPATARWRSVANAVQRQ